MSKQRINTGSGINTGTGDSLRDAMDKINNNFDELYDIIGQDSTGKSIDIAGNTISSTFTNTDINISPNGTGDTVIDSDLVVNTIKSDDSSEVTVNDGLNVNGNVTATAFVGDGSGLTNAIGDDIVVNNISSSDSTAVQLNDGLNVSGDTKIHGALKLAFSETDGSTATIDVTKSIAFLQGGTSGGVDKYQYVMPNGTYKGQKITLVPEAGANFDNINVTITARTQTGTTTESLDWQPFTGSGTLNQYNACIWDGSAWVLLHRISA